MSPEQEEVIAKLRQAAECVRQVLDEMAVVPSAHRARLMVALRLLDELRVQLAAAR